MKSSTGLIRILAADDHPLLRAGIAALIGTQSDMALVAEASTGREAIEKFRSVRPDITLLDLQMPEMSGIDALIAIRSEWPSAKVIVLTTYGGDALAERALKAGAQAYVLKALVGAELLETIRAVHTRTQENSSNRGRAARESSRSRDPLEPGSPGADASRGW